MQFYDKYMLRAGRTVDHNKSGERVACILCRTHRVPSGLTNSAIEAGRDNK